MEEWVPYHGWLWVRVVSSRYITTLSWPNVFYTGRSRPYPRTSVSLSHSDHGSDWTPLYPSPPVEPETGVCDGRRSLRDMRWVELGQ